MDIRPDDAVRQLRRVTDLVGARTEIAGEVIQVGVDRWAIYGSIPVDGNVLVAEYESPQMAHDVLQRLGPSPDRAADEWL